MSEQAKETAGERADWPLRPWLLAALLGLAGLLVWLVTKGKEDDPLRMAGAAFLFFGPLAAAFLLERTGWKEAVAFALATGLVMAGLAWRAVSAQERLADEGFGFAAGVFATVIALPLFQSGFHRTRFATPYRAIHFHAWTDALSAAGSLAFLGLAWLMTVLLANLFHLLKIDVLMDLIDRGWFVWMLSGAAFGAALGVFRNRIGILGTLQHVVMLVLALLAVPLAAGLVVFLAAMGISGPGVLWEATRSATPVLLACALGAFVLANAIVRDDDGAMTRSPVMRITALVLALTLLPLTVFAAVSMGTRIDAHGLSPERLWALVAIAAACSCGLAYLVAVVRGRFGAWPPLVRRANVNLAAGLGVVALLLALPILDFGVIAAANQIARLERGAVSAQKFDYTALRWHFGEAGRKALAKLARSGDQAVAERARIALAQAEPAFPGENRTIRTAGDFHLRVQPEDSVLRRQMIEYLIARPFLCMEYCLAVDLGRAKDGQRKVAFINGSQVSNYDTLLLAEGRPVTHMPRPASDGVPFTRASRVEIRPVTARYLFIDGNRVGNPID